MGSLPVVRLREVVATLLRAGFIAHHQTGSHLVLKNRDVPPRRVTVPMHARDIKYGTLRSILREAGLSIDEFLALL